MSAQITHSARVSTSLLSRAMRVDRRVGARLPRARTVTECAGLLRCVSNLIAGSERPLLPLLR
jgi:hypothetical protein